MASPATSEDEGVNISRRHVWRVINYLQRDALGRGVLRNGPVFGSFWNNLSRITDAAVSHRLYVALNSRNHIVGYMVVGRDLESRYRESGILPLHIFEVLPRFRNKGNGEKIVELLKETAFSTGYCGIKVEPANNSNVFWNKMGFTVPGDNENDWICPIAWAEDMTGSEGGSEGVASPAESV